ncbi:hypothetical protein B0H13DRAFT_192593 [Mycena leptocephala]|nr:hypothetical protein B0H13DRAFT_192593 [Mycena leptocephala]
MSPYDDRPETPVNSFTPKDLTCIQANFSIGGCLMSIHEPAEAASWMEDNWDNPLLTLIRNNGCGGPFAWMLSPTKPALVIFGCHNEPIVVNMVQSLANLSGFPVVIRPSDDNPALTLVHDPDPNVSVDFGGAVGNNNQTRHDVDIVEAMADEGEHPPGESGNSGRRDDDHDDAESNGHGLNTAEEHKPNRGYKGAPGIIRSGGGGGDDGGGGATTVNGKWESPLHRTLVKLHLKLNTAHTYTVTIGYTFKFIINREAEIPIDLDNLTRPLSRPEVIALVDLKIGTRLRETQVDRSYANIGFVSHRRESIIDHEFVHRGFDLPDKLYKHGQHRQYQRGIETNLGISQGSPLATATFSYNLNNDVTMEATDSKVMPRCRVDYETGDEWDKDNKSYFSYNIVYQVQDIRLDTERREFHPLEVKIGMGINLRPAASGGQDF